MPERALPIVWVTTGLEGEVGLTEALFHPEVIVCEVGEEKRRGLAAGVLRQVIERLGAGALHARMPGALPEVSSVRVQVEGPPRSAAWTGPVELELAVLTWTQGSDAHLASVPALGIEVVGATQAELRKRLPEHVKFALRRTGAWSSLLELALLERAREVRVEAGQVTAEVKSPREEAAEEDRRAKKKARPVIEEVGEVLDPERMEPAYEVDRWVAPLAEALYGRRPRSVVLVGPAGVGKTAVVREMVRRRGGGAGEAPVPQPGRGPVWSTSGSRLVAGMSGYGMWQERCQKLVREAREAGAVVHVGSLVELMEVGRAEGQPLGIASFFRPYVGRGDVVMVAECTPEQLAAIERQDAHLVEAFSVLRIEEPTREQAREILRQVAADDGARRKAEGRRQQDEADTSPRAVPALPSSFILHPSTVADDALAELDRLHRRYAGYSAYPGRPLRFLRNLVHDRPAGRQVGVAEVTAAFAKETGLPAFLLDDDVPLDVDAARRWFSARVIGQEEAVETVAGMLATVKAALNRPRRPIASLLLVGPTGVGKTEMAKSLAAYFFGDEGRLTRFDMSEYDTPLAVSRLCGGAFGPEGLLTAKVREQPFSVVLLDEIEKADASLFDLLLQVLGEGRLTDAAGRVADFTNAVVVMTSNLGTATFRQGGFGLSAAQGRRDEAVRMEAVRAEARRHFVEAVREFVRPELFNRIDRVVPFLPLGREAVLGIVRRELELIEARDGIRKRGVAVTWGPGVAEHLAEAGYDEAYGARPIKRLVAREVLAPLAEGINAYAGALKLTAAVTLEGHDGRPHRLRVSVRARGEEGGDRAAELADLADRASAWRRAGQALARCAALRGVHNEVFTIHRAREQEAARARARRRPPAYDVVAERRLARLESIASGAAGVLARATALEDEVLAAIHEHVAADRRALARSLDDLARDHQAALLALYALRHDEPDRALVGLYGEHHASAFRLAGAYAELAAALGGKVEVHWYERHGKHSLRRHRADDPRAFLASGPRAGAVGLALVASAPCAMARLEGEAGVHIFEVGEEQQRHEHAVLVDVSAESIDAYRPPADVEKRGTIGGGAWRRKYRMERRELADPQLGWSPRWPGTARFEEAVAEAIAGRLDKVLREMVAE